MAKFTLTNKSDIFTSLHRPGWDDGSEVSGGNGNDCITVFGDCNSVFGGNGEDLLVAIGSANVLDGGNGKDVLKAIGDDNVLLGGNGVDHLVAFGEGNLLDGGNAADWLISTSRGAFREIGEGNVLTGGHAFDVFVLNNRSDLRVINDTGGGPHPAVLPGHDGAGAVSEGDVIVGVMDEITDYTAGERLRIGATKESHDPVGLDSFVPGPRHLQIEDGEYAFVRGDQISNGRFEVDGGGGDLLLVYDATGGGDAPFLQGAVVLLGVTDPDAVFIC